MKAQHQPLENGQVKLWPVCSLSQSSAGQFASLFLLAVQFDNYPGPGKKWRRHLLHQEVTLHFSLVSFPVWILLSCACLFCPVSFCQQFLFHLWFLSHKDLVSFINSHLASTFLFFPALLIKDFPSFVFSLPPLLSCSLPLSPSLPSHPGTPSPLLPLPQCHCVHMAPACDMKLSQNTPDARFSPSLFQTLLNFKQNKRTGEGGRRENEKKEKSEHVVPGECATTSQFHSFTRSVPLHHHTSTAL